MTQKVYKCVQNVFFCVEKPTTTATKPQIVSKPTPHNLGDLLAAAATTTTAPIGRLEDQHFISRHRWGRGHLFVICGLYSHLSYYFLSFVAFPVTM